MCQPRPLSAQRPFLLYPPPFRRVLTHPGTGRFEAGAIGGSPRDAVEAELGTLKVGWEGAERSKERSNRATKGAGRGEGRQGLAVCVCFEGGPGTIGTIKVSARVSTCACVCVLCARARARKCVR